MKEKNGEHKLFNLDKDISETSSLNDSIKMDLLLKNYNQWNDQNIDPLFFGLMQNEAYNELHPDRFEDVEKY